MTSEQTDRLANLAAFLRESRIYDGQAMVDSRADADALDALLSRLSHQDAEIARLREALEAIVREATEGDWQRDEPDGDPVNNIFALARAALSPIPEDGTR